jgi:Holliday junction resolvase RusA-like endonuclease
MPSSPHIEPLNLFIPGPVVAHQRPVPVPEFVRGRNGKLIYNKKTGLPLIRVKMVIPEKTRLYRDQIAQLARIKMFGRQMFQGAVNYSVCAVMRLPKSATKQQRAMAAAGTLWPTKKPDTDNILKLKDALNGIVWPDDKQVVCETGYKKYGDKEGLHILIREMERMDLFTRYAEREAA